MTKEQLALYADRFRCGDKVLTDNPAESGKEVTQVTIMQKYPKFAVVTNGKYRWCKHWTDLKIHNS